MFLNENNLQAPFQYKISENSFKLEKINNSLQLSEDNEQVKVFEGEKLFCVDIGYGINGALEEMEFILDGVRVYPVLLDDINCIRELEEVEENKIYLIKNDINFKSIIFLSVTHLNKQFEYSITAYNTTLSSWMFDYIAKKVNSLDTNYPIKNYYNKINYKINDIIKHNGYLYKVNKDFLSDDSDYYLKSNCSILTPFKSIEIGNSYNAGDILEYENNFFAVSKNFVYSEENDIYDFIKPLIEIINWFDGIKKIYKNQIIIKNGLLYLVLDYVENPIWNNIIRDNKIEILSKASNIFYDDSNTSFGGNTNNVQLAIENLKKDIENKIPTGSSNLASNILYDNSKTNLVYETDEYDFPKFKIPIFDTINLVLTDNINDYAATITKQENGNYLLNCKLDNVQVGEFGAIFITVKNLENDSNFFKIYSILSQFFEFSSSANKVFYNLESEECLISSIDNPLKFAVIIQPQENYENNKITLVIANQEESPIDQNNYNITLNIKNRLLRNQDTNLFGISNAVSKIEHFNFTSVNNTIKLIGEYEAIVSNNVDGMYFYSPIIENYFNMSNDLISTSGITSSSGKAVKFNISKLNNTAYILGVAYQDGSKIQQGDIFTFNLTPDKNYLLDPIYQNVTNVQELGESLALRYMIAPYYTQYTDNEGNFNPNEEPSNWFSKMYGVTTTWQIMFNTESVYFRTEGGLANVNRSNGIQGDAGRNALGKFVARSVLGTYVDGVFYINNETDAYPYQFNTSTQQSSSLNIDLSRIYTTANEFRVRNRLMRIYKLLTINGKNVNDIIGA